MDYILNVFRNKEFLFAIGGKHMNYDNVIWWQLDKVINIVESGCYSKEQLIDSIVNNTEYFKIILNEECSFGDKLDITNKTIVKPCLQLFALDEVNYKNCSRELLKIDNKYFIKIEDDDDMYDVCHKEFDIRLLMKKEISFEEYKIISKFIDDLLNEYQNDIIINNELFLWLTEI